MTTKPKTRRPAALKPAPEAGEPKRKSNEICTLVSRWRWLEADQEYKATTAATEEESERLVAIHHDEQGAIESQLATLVPESFVDGFVLFDFVLKNAEGSMLEETDIDMLANINRSLRAIWRDEIDKAREAGAAKARASMRGSYLFALASAEKAERIA